MSVLSLPDAKAHLNIEGETYDQELTAFIAAAEGALAQLVGPLSTSTVTRRVAGYGWGLHLPISPAVSLTSVTPVGGTALTLGDLYLDQESATVSYTSGSFFYSMAYDVVYTAGRSTVPPDLLMAVKKQLKRMWSDQRGGANRPGATTAADQVAFSAQVGAVAPDVLTLIAPYRLQVIGA